MNYPVLSAPALRFCRSVEVRGGRFAEQTAFKT